MKILHILAFSLLASLLSTAAPSPLTPLPREQPQWWRKQYEQQVEQIKNNPCGVLFLGDSITDYWKREGKPIWEKAFSPYHPCNFGISGDQTSNLIYRITDSGIPAQTDPKLCIVMIGTNNTGYFKGGEAPEKTAMGILGTVEHLLVRFPDTHVSCWAFSRAAQAPRTSCASTTTASTPFWPSASCPAPLTPTSTGAFWTPPANCSPASAGTTCTLRKKATPSGQTPCCPISKNTANSFLSHPRRMTVGMPPSASHACGSGTYLSINDEAYAATTVQPSF